ncbi:carbohydrate ABC transporter permease [Cellulomonas sp. PS-H5]|uniref:carbohydrate ABC transporter permease n=1 Tax=Cellulomonas sp. PS-H5 TaxID=2820400 RepID=UPI001C4E99A6|nr:sugar ABC transporter permease [Cellulomonas sp. PS-H5]MBW0252527.1 sugar ABC transporter permease [Cellulomonas sp. PS-H5]
MSSSATRERGQSSPAEAEGEPRARRPIHHREKWAALVLLVPAMVGFVVFWILPSGRSIWYSLTDFDLLNDPQFIGLDNYRELLTDEVARNSLVVTIQFVVASVVLGTVLALLTAALMQRLRLKTWVRSILLLPWLVPNVAIALIWAWLLDGQLGYLNHLLHAVGLPGVSFYNASQAMPIIIAIGIWSGLGYTALLLYAGMTQVPNEMYEAGAIDGATEKRMFFQITLPLIRPVIALVVVMSAIGSFQVFDLVLIGYGGNPIPAVRTIFFYIYQQSFAFFRMGYGSAIALVLAVILGALTAIQMRAMRANRSDLS